MNNYEERCRQSGITPKIRLTPEIVATAIFHDTVEDSSITFQQLLNKLVTFGESGKKTAEYVYILSKKDVSFFTGTEKEKKELRESIHLDTILNGPLETLFIKIIDRLSNNFTDYRAESEDPKYALNTLLPFKKHILKIDKELPDLLGDSLKLGELLHSLLMHQILTSKDADRILDELNSNNTQPLETSFEPPLTESLISKKITDSLIERMHTDEALSRNLTEPCYTAFNYGFIISSTLEPLIAGQENSFTAQLLGNSFLEETKRYFKQILQGDFEDIGIALLKLRDKLLGVGDQFVPQQLNYWIENIAQPLSVICDTKIAIRYQRDFPEEKYDNEKTKQVLQEWETNFKVKRYPTSNHFR